MRNSEFDLNMELPFDEIEIEGSIADRFNRVVEWIPEWPAVKSEIYSWTYSELEQQASYVAHMILDQIGSGLETVGLLFKHEASLIAAIFGAVKAGKIFSVLNPGFPVKRLNEILVALNTRLLVVDTENYALIKDEILPGCALLIYQPGEIESSFDNIDINLSSTDPLVVTFTSGSTGKPKGVCLNHETYLHRIWIGRKQTPIIPKDRHSLLTACSFLGAITDVLRALLNGCTLCIFDVDDKGLPCLGRWLNQEGITLFHPPVSLFRHFLSTVGQNDFFPTVRNVALSADVLLRKDLERARHYFSPGCVFEHRYASSEIIVGAQLVIKPDTPLEDEIIPAGFPLAGKDIWIVDDENIRLDTGQIGRIAVRSRFLASGYWHQPKETAKQFFNDPLDSTKRIFISNDLGRIRPDGMLEFLGREDRAVKIRGIQVNPAEIEAALLKMSIREAAVVTQTDPEGEVHLLAYLVPFRDQKPDPAYLRNELAKNLPDYMLPAFYIYLVELPTLHSGKIDRLALPNPLLVENKEQADFQSGLSELNFVEEKVYEFIRSILKQEGIGLHENIFVRGCNSLLAARIIAKINEHFRVEIPIREIYNYPTVSDLAGFVQTRQNQSSPERIIPVLDASTLDYLSQFA